MHVLVNPFIMFYTVIDFIKCVMCVKDRQSHCTFRLPLRLFCLNLTFELLNVHVLLFNRSTMNVLS